MRVIKKSAFLRLAYPRQHGDTITIFTFPLMDYRGTPLALVYVVIYMTSNFQVI